MMIATKEEAGRALVALNKLCKLVKEHGSFEEEVATGNLLRFILAAQRRLPRESSYLAERARRRKKPAPAGREVDNA